jgi:DNA (cytosine-5)-methyltransferase 1
MKHLGNIRKINVDNVESVDCVIGGSPCQDLSIAGKRAGLDGERSGLFMEQIRICREMRESDKARGKTGIDVRPRFCVWENVPGALSSHSGEDFRIVLEEFCKVADPSAHVHEPANGKWKSAGCIVGNGYSVAWRIMDARYYGVPQRRRRISLVADFAGGCAPQILFDEQGMRWNLETSRKAWESITSHATGSVGGSCGIGVILNDQGGNRMNVSETVASTLRAQEHGHPPVIVQDATDVKCLNPWDFQSKRLFDANGIYHSLYAGENGGGKGYREDVCYTLNTIDRPAICFKTEHGAKVRSSAAPETVTPTMESEPSRKTVPELVYSIEGSAVDREKAQNGKGFSEDVSPTLNVQDKHAVCYDARGNGDGKTVCTITGDHCDRITDYTPLVLATDQGGVEIGKDESSCLMAGHERPIVTAVDCIMAKPPRKYIIRRLTPLECSRLQGLPDDHANVPLQQTVTDSELDFWREVWVEWAEINGKKPKTDKQIQKRLQSPISESNQYQIYGNGIALPQWVWVLGRICEVLGKERPTMASLFDGSGSFPLIWEAINGKGTALWSSEVNPDAIRVSKYRIG